MRLYHGTTEAVARGAFTHGLRPRGRAAGNWTLPSNAKTVYLTDVYAGYFAANATGGGRWGLVEIDVNRLEQSRLQPDEDWCEQAMRGHPGQPTGNLRERTLWWRRRAHLYAGQWRASLEGLGTIGHRGTIPGSAVTRVAIFDPASNATVGMAAMDPSISLANHALCKEKYAALTAWIFGDPCAARTFLGWQDMDTLSTLPTDHPLRVQVDTVERLLEVRTAEVIREGTALATVPEGSR